MNNNEPACLSESCHQASGHLNQPTLIDEGR